MSELTAGDLKDGDYVVGTESGNLYRVIGDPQSSTSRLIEGEVVMRGPSALPGGDAIGRRASRSIGMLRRPTESELRAAGVLASTPAWQVGDIAVGSSGSTWRVIDIRDNGVLQLHVELIEGKGDREGQAPGRKRWFYADQFAGKRAPSHREAPIPSTNQPTNQSNTNVQEDNIMKNNNISTAISTLRQEDANAKVEPVYRKMAKLAEGTKTGQAIVLTKKGEPSRFLCRTHPNRFIEADWGTRDVDDAVDRLVHSHFEGWKAKRLVAEKK